MSQIFKAPPAVSFDFTSTGGTIDITGSPISNGGTVNFEVHSDSGLQPFTPIIYGQNTAGVTVYSAFPGSQSGFYCTIENMVFVWFFTRIASATGTGNLLLGNLPVAFNASVPAIAACQCSYPYPPNCTYITIQGIAGTNHAAVAAFGSGPTVESFVQIGNFGNAILSGTLTYTI